MYVLLRITIRMSRCFFSPGPGFISLMRRAPPRVCWNAKTPPPKTPQSTSTRQDHHNLLPAHGYAVEPGRVSWEPPLARLPRPCACKCGKLVDPKPVFDMLGCEELYERFRLAPARRGAGVNLQQATHRISAEDAVSGVQPCPAALAAGKGTKEPHHRDHHHWPCAGSSCAGSSCAGSHRACAGSCCAGSHRACAGSSCAGS